MKYAIIAFLISLSALCSAQSSPPQKVGANYQFKAAGADSAQRLPLRHSIDPNYRAPGMIWFNQTQGIIYWSTTGTDSATFNGSPSPPLQSVQTNQGNQFKGFATFVYDSVHHILIVDTSRQIRLTIDGDTSHHNNILEHFTVVRGPGFYTSLNQDFRDNPDGFPDNVLGYGAYNLNGDGQRLDPNYPGMGWFQESHFQASGSKQMELHLVFVDSSGRTRRLFSILPNELSGNGTSYYTINDMGWKSDASGEAGYFNISEQGIDNIRAHAIQFRLIDTIGNWGQLLIETNDAGVVSISNETSNATSQIQYNTDVTMQGTDGNPLSIVMGDAPNTTGILGAGTAHANGVGFANNFHVDASAVLANIYDNTSTQNGAAVAERLGTAGTGASYTIYRKDYVGGVHGDFNVGQRTVDSSFTIAYNDAGEFTSGVLMKAMGSTSNVSIGPNAPDPNAKLDIQSTTQGLLPPRMTTGQRDAMGPVTEGMFIYNLTTHHPNYYNGTAWVQL